ncbi:unnamed protein product (macronuclear) [Paramecium tetraurelia]|uniref:Alpha-type protein kinase domain-containing protein n=1 Tax=Paramecium tetraurelia TaxID=5888 RepID=A0BUE3_PARTE|nr:uncharacterized protein GSPATT00032392001 [Paramecium tetraurelia]CAK62160.1 unnamed protein product [Paramecium tetraurelia]|eukprot:XP_001429558.1 hypothetical protein (macronuclear) [Paramecium tetraurelia strain d4-2]
MNYHQRIKELCPFNIQCKDEVCNFLHPRCLAGVCIWCLQNNKEKCDGTLLNLSNKELRSYLQQQKINGVFAMNLCKKQNQCEDKQNCRFLHRKWAEGICIQDIIDECSNTETCQLQHVSWELVKKEAYAQFNIHNTNPESIENTGNHKLPDNLCIQYLTGVCEFYTSCSKIHVDWECLKNSSYTDIRDTRRKSCLFEQSTSIMVQSEKFTRSDVANAYFDKIYTNQIKKMVQKAQVIDVLFIIDITGSMQRWLTSAKSNIHKIIEEFQTQIDKKKNIVRTAIVAYRDFGDEDNMLYREFTSDTKIIFEFLNQLQAKGGGDDPEDVIGALEKGFRLNISKDVESVLCTFLICDNPCHGPYHENLQDEHFDKVKKGDLEKIMQKYFNLKKFNFFTCYKITDATDLMFNKMQTTFPTLKITVSTPDDFKQQVIFSLQQSLKQSETKTSNTQQTQRIRANFSKSKPFEMSNSLLKDNNIDYWKNFQKQQEQNSVEGETLLIINKNQEILPEKDRGQLCQIFKLFDVVLNRNLVLKLPYYIIESYNKQKELSQKENEDYQLFIKKRYISLLIAQQLADSFRQKTQSIEGAPPIFYVSPIIYELQTPFMGVTKLFAETYIDLPNFCEWKKYTNNTKYADQDEYYYTSFSHYSYEATQGKLIITDLQGKNNILSDPSIHTIDEEIREMLGYDETDFKENGVLLFFQQQHRYCHNFCKKLNLKPFQDCQELSSNSNNIIEINKSISWGCDDVVYVICQVCGEFQDLKYDDYLKKHSCTCDNCLEDKEPILLTCICCRKQFKCFYNQEVKVGKIPSKCDQCISKCVKGNLECVYCSCYCESRVNNKQVGDDKIAICNEGVRFLNALKCSKCNQLYNYEVQITADDYKISVYVCKNCKQLK